MRRQAAVIVIAAAFLAVLPASPASGSDAVAFGLQADAERVIPGEPVLIRVTAMDAGGAPVGGIPLEISPEDARTTTSREGVAWFRVQRDQAESVTFTVSRADTGRVIGTVSVHWSEIQWTLNEPVHQYFAVGELARFTGSAQWVLDSTPARGLQMYVMVDDVVHLSKLTDREGRTEVLVGFTVPGQRVFQMAGAGDPVRSTVELVWRQQSDPNRAPVLESLDLEFEGRTAIAIPGETRDPDGDAVSVRYEWRVNGSRVEGAGPSIRVAPESNVEVTAYPSDGKVAGNVLTAQGVSPENQAPIADFEFSTDSDGAFVTLDASASSDPEDDGLSFTWLSNGVEQATGRVANLPVPQEGLEVTLRVRDEWGATDTATVQLPGWEREEAQEPDASESPDEDSDTSSDPVEGDGDDAAGTGEPDAGSPSEDDADISSATDAPDGSDPQKDKPVADPEAPAEGNEDADSEELEPTSQPTDDARPAAGGTSRGLPGAPVILVASGVLLVARALKRR